MAGCEKANALCSAKEQAKMAGLLVANNIDDPIRFVGADAVVKCGDVGCVVREAWQL
jgi:hypothetical protein